MKAIALFGILAQLAEAAIIERQERGHAMESMAPKAKVQAQHLIYNIN
jgi:hypothetical protein